MNRSWFSCLIFFLIVAAFAFGQYIPSKRYTTLDGMLTNKITCITQDSSGYMWFGSYFGLLKYNGYQFHNIDLPEEMRNKFVSSITSSGDKVYAGFWFDGGLLELYKGKSQKVFLPDTTFKNVNYLTTNKDGSITIVAFKNGAKPEVIILKYKDGKFWHIWNMDPVYENITGIERDMNGNLWIGTRKGLLIRSVSGVLTRFLKDSLIYNISRNTNGDMVVVSGKVLQIFKSPENITLKYNFSDDDFIFPKLTGNNTAGYFGYSPSKGLLHVEDNGKITHYNINLPPKTNTSDLFMDREKNLWFITDGGLLKFNSFNALSYMFNEPSPGAASILQHGDQIYLTNGRSLFSFTNGKLERIKHFEQSGNLGVLFHDHHDNFWIGQWSGDQGLWKARLGSNENKAEQVFYKKYDHEIISAFVMQEDDLGTLWIAGGYGIFLYKNGRITKHYKLILGGRSEPILAMTLDKQKKCAWLGTNGLGLVKIQYNIANDGNYNFEIADKIDQDDGLKDPYIRGNLLLDANGKLWIGSRSSGLSYLIQKENKYLINYVPQKEGIGCGRISSIKEYNNFIWVSTCDGIYKIKDSVIIKKYNNAHGLLENDVLDFIVDNDNLIAATSEGVTQVKLVDDYLPVPSVVISEVKIDGVANSYLYKSEEPYLPDGKNSIGFTFTANSFIDERKVLYKHKLDGFDKDWSPPGSSNTIDYASLSPGNYSFKVIAQNARGIWSKAPVVFSFHVTEPFYKSSWFAMAVVFVLLMLTDLIRSYRMKQLDKIQKLRQSIARDLHDDIGSALGSINILSKTAQRRIKNDSNTEHVISKIGTTAQKTLESMDEIIWTINPTKEKVIDLVVRMQNFAQPLLESEGIQFNLVSNVPDLHKLDMKVKRNFYLIFKELIYNAIRHARCTTVDVNLYKQNKILVLQIKDDGIGLKTDEYNDRNGLRNIKDRIVSIGGNLIIESENGKGTNCIVKAG